MTSRTNLEFVLRKRPSPTGAVVPGETFEKRVTPGPTADDLKDGQVLLETLYASLDPGVRGFLGAKHELHPELPLGSVIPGAIVGRILSSNSGKFKAGDLVNASTGWREVAIANEAEVQPLSLPPNASPVDALGIFGVNGLTAYHGITKIAKIQPGDTVLVSSAAGATGIVVGQMARIFKAGRVVGLAGSDEKCRWLVEECGFDTAVNYKSVDFIQKLREATPNLVDVYWDGVGGRILEEALYRAARNARFVVCGSISGYNSAINDGPKNLYMIGVQRVRVEGFSVFDHIDEHPQALSKLYEWYSQGKLKGKTTLMTGGLEKVELAWARMFEGQNTGKMVLEVQRL